MKKITLSFALCAGLFGCTDKPTETPVSTESQPTTTSEQIPSNLPSDAPVVRVVTSGVLPPLTFLDERGTLTGIDVDIIHAIGENQGFKVELHKELFVDMLPGLESGKYQAVISGLSPSPERIAKFNPTNAYLQNPSVIMHQPNLTVTDVASLKPLRVATMKDTTQEKLINELAPASHEAVETVFQLYQGLIQQKYDAVLQDKYFLEHIAANYPDYQMNVVEYDKTPNAADIVIYTQKGDQELLDKINAGIDNLQQSVEIDRIISKYLTVPTAN